MVFGLDSGKASLKSQFNDGFVYKEGVTNEGEILKIVTTYYPSPCPPLLNSTRVGSSRVIKNGMSHM